MDVAYYISELLMQRGEVNVPGLGYFAQLKVAGYYDNAAKEFCPPTNKISFEEQYLDDDILLQYIADKKRISLASSKYFTAKFIDNIRLEAMQKEVQLADLGTLHFEDTKLTFKPAEVLPVDPLYYGFPKIRINKLEGTSIYEQMEKERPTPTYVKVVPAQQPTPAVPIGAPPVLESPDAYNDSPFAAPTYSENQSADNEEEFIFHGRGYSGAGEERKSYNWIWITLIAVVVLAIGGIFALHQVKPGFFKHTAPAPLILKTTLKHDTVKTATPAIKVDTATANTKTAAADTMAKPAGVNNSASLAIDSMRVRFEVIGTTAPTLAAANKAVANYKSVDIQAHVVNATPGKRTFKISLGTYYTHAEAMDAINKLVESGKVKKGIWPLQINPKK